MSMFSKLGVSNVGKLIELRLLPFGILGLTFLGFTRALIALALFFRPFLHFLPKCMFLRNLGSIPLRYKDLYLCDWGFLMPFLCHVQGWLCMVWFLNLAISALKPTAPKLPGTRVLMNFNGIDFFANSEIHSLKLCCLKETP